MSGIFCNTSENIVHCDKTYHNVDIRRKACLNCKFNNSKQACFGYNLSNPNKRILVWLKYTLSWIQRKVPLQILYYRRYRYVSSKLCLYWKIWMRYVSSWVLKLEERKND
ncbi:uncharacterized protein LOC113218636 [Apis mellifera]|uniref:Uncharacterized protein LOC113218636 n=1 Tax=Apis mellifera TaxID=7460 RepID=A0A7M7MK79_APIME|nr:uncharacterized protein LOC113218636 [Apis mellifera]|eukprot:XP_026295390.1 uncharacterized protein LOC113218636 [Apis mellifera]